MKNNYVNFFKYVKAFYGTFALIVFAFVMCLVFTFMFHAWGFLLIAGLIFTVYAMIYYVFYSLLNEYVEVEEARRKEEAEEQLAQLEKFKKLNEPEIDFNVVNKNN